MKAYPRSFLKVFWWTQSLLAISGLLLLPGMLALRLEWDVPLTVLLDSRVLLSAVHGLLAFVALLAFGALLPIHVRHGLRQHKNKYSGIALLGAFVVLLLTGWGIYYLADEQWSVWTSVLHVLIAFLLVLILPAHVVLAHRLRSSRPMRR